MPRKRTSPRAASAAGKVLSNEKQDRKSKIAAASALSQHEHKGRPRKRKAKK